MDNKNIEVAMDTLEEEVKEDIMTVAEFVELYENDKTKDKTDVKKKLKVIPYLDYEVKIALAENIINHANVDSKTGNVMLNSPMRFLFYVYTVVNKYTNVRMGVGDMFGDFNALNSRGLIEFLMKQIPEKELNELTTMIDMVSDDLIANKYELHSYIRELSEKFFTFVSEYLAPLSDTLNQLSEAINEAEANSAK